MLYQNFSKLILLLTVLLLISCSVKFNPVHCEINVKQGSTNIHNKTGLFDFGNIPLGFSQNITFTILNTGKDDLHLYGYPVIRIIGANKVDFIGSTDLTRNLIPALSSTTFSVNFFPTDVGTRTATIEIYSNDSDMTPFTFVMVGTCTAPAPEIHIKQGTNDIMSTSGSYDFGFIDAGSTSSEVLFTIENNGSKDLQLTGNPKLIRIEDNESNMFLAFDQNTQSIIPSGNSTNFVVKFAPTSPGLKTAKIVILNTDSDENPYTFTVTGTGVAVPEIAVKQGNTDITSGAWTFDFKEVSIGSSSEVLFRIENLGTATLHLSNSPDYVKIEGDNPSMFEVNLSTTDESVGIGESTTFTLKFKPTVSGDLKAVVSISNNDSDENPFTFNVKGKCVSPEMNVKRGFTQIPNTTGSYDFGEKIIGSSTFDIIFTIESLGENDLKLTGNPTIDIIGTDASMFTLDTNNLKDVIPPNTTTGFKIKFKPSRAGNISATVSIENNDFDENPYTFTITGKGRIANSEINIREYSSVDIPCTTGVYDFGDTANGFSSSNANFVIENKGTDRLYLTGSPIVESSGPDASMFYIIQGSTSSFVEPGKGTIFIVIFKPTSLGPKSATLSIANNDQDENPYTFTVKGVGAVPKPEINLSQNGTKIPHLSSFCMGHINIASVTAEATFTIDNVYGTANLVLTGTPKIVLSGTDAAMFSINESATSSSIAPSGSTTFKVKFTPTSTGTKYAKISIANNDSDENPYVFDLTAISSIFGQGQAFGWIGGGSNGWKTTNGTWYSSDYQSFDHPWGMCLDSSDNIYVADQDNNRICKWDKNGNAIGWIGGGSNGWKTGVAPSSEGSDLRSFYEPKGVFVDNSGYIYVADDRNHRVSKWDSNGNAIGWIGGGSNGWKTGTAPSNGANDYQSFSNAVSVFVDNSGSMFITDSYNNRVCKWDKNGIAIGWIGDGSNGWKTISGSTTSNRRDYQSFNLPRGIYVDSSGYIYVSDTTNNRLCKWDSNGNAIGWLGDGTDGWKTSSDYASGYDGYRFLNGPNGITIDSSGNIYISDSSHNRISLWDKDANAMGWIGGGYTGWQTIDGATKANDYKSFEYPIAVALDLNGDIIILDYVNNRVCKWTN